MATDVESAVATPLPPPSSPPPPSHDLTPASMLLSASAKDSPHYHFPFDAFLQREHTYPRPAVPHKSTSTLICKHWLRGLCKKGAHCEFLHEYNLRSMPECSTYAKYHLCPNGTDCLFMHLDHPPAACAHYERGFCPLGPACANTHVKSRHAGICRFYLAGFCPNGTECGEGAHPVWREKEEMEKPKLKKLLTKEEEEREREAAAERLERDREAFEEREAAKEGGGRGRGRGGRGRWQGRKRERY